jgi:hypothetical protein
MAKKNYRTPHLPHEKHGEKIDRCWLWKGKPNNSGYGVFKMQGENYLAHRIAYKLGIRRRSRQQLRPPHLQSETLL